MSKCFRQVPPVIAPQRENGSQRARERLSLGCGVDRPRKFLAKITESLNICEHRGQADRQALYGGDAKAFIKGWHYECVCSVQGYPYVIHRTKEPNAVLKADSLR